MIMNEDVIGLGSEIKLNLNINTVGGYTMDDYDFVAEVYCKTKKSVIVEKSQAIRIDANNYLLPVDTQELGHGYIKCKVTAQIPDKDFFDGTRTEVVFIETNIEIIKSL